MKLNLEDSSYQRNKNKYNKKTEKKNYFPIMNRKKSLDNSFINNSFKLSNNYWINLEKKPIFSFKGCVEAFHHILSYFKTAKEYA